MYSGRTEMTEALERTFKTRKQKQRHKALSRRRKKQYVFVAKCRLEGTVLGGSSYEVHTRKTLLHKRGSNTDCQNMTKEVGEVNETHGKLLYTQSLLCLSPLSRKERCFWKQWQVYCISICINICSIFWRILFAIQINTGLMQLDPNATVCE